VSDRYLHEGQQRILKVILALAGRELSGLAPGEIAKGLDITPSCVTRDLANLQAAGFAEPIAETGRWRLGPKLVQIAVSFAQELNNRRSQLDEILQRYTRTPS